MSSLQSRELTRTEEYLRELPHVAGGDDEQVLPQRDADLRRHKQKAPSVFGRRAAAPQGKAVPLSPPHPQVVLCHPLGRGPEQLQVLRAQDVSTATRACPNIHAHTKEMTNSAQSTYMSSL